MVRAGMLVLLALFALAAAGCAASRPSSYDFGPDNGFFADTANGGGSHPAHDRCCGEKGPKALFEWAVCDKGEKKKGNGKEEKPNGEKEKDKENVQGNEKDADKGQGEGKAKNGANEKADANGGGSGNGNGEEEEEEEKIQTDRPDFTEASSTVGLDRIQLESGYTFIRDREGSTTRTAHSFPEALLRIGLFADWFEFRIGQNLAGEREASPEIVKRASGAEDLYLGVKLALTKQKGVLPEMALTPQMTVPTGSGDLTAGEVLPGLNFLFGWEVLKDRLDLGGSLQANRAVDDSGHFYVEVAPALTAGFWFTEWFGAYTEWFALFPAGAIDPGAGPEHYFNGGLKYLVTPNFQLDVRAGVGLNKHADDFFAGSGFAVRY